MGTRRKKHSETAHRVTPMGVTGRGGGVWNTVPQPPVHYGSTAQLCGMYPFSSGTQRPTVGTPLGRDLKVHTAVAGDMLSWFNEGLISSPTMMLFGLNGYGKSSIAQRLGYGLNHRGCSLGFFDPIKNEHAQFIQGLGGTVISIGERSRHRINPLDLGALGEAADKVGGQLGEEMRAQAIEQAKTLMALLVEVNRARPLDDIEETALSKMVESVISRIDRPWIKHIEQAFEHPPPEVVAEVGQRTPADFRQRFTGLHESVLSVAHGQLAHLIGGHESVRLPVGNRGGFCFDTSSIPLSRQRLLSAAMLSTWAIGFSTIDAHWELAKYERRQADEARAAGERYEPKVTWNGYLTVQDEFWYPMRVCSGIIDRADTLGRTNRSVGTAELRIVHTPKDALSLPNPDDREKAKGFAQRSGVLGLMALSRDDLVYLSENVMPLNEKEMSLVASFMSSPSWKGKRDPLGNPVPPEGAGKILLKVANRVGIPVKMTLTDLEKSRHVTDERFRARAEKVTA